MSQETITQEDFYNVIMDKAGVSRTIAVCLLKTLLKKMRSGIAYDHTLKLAKFGSFSVIQKNQRMGRNPKTKEPALITPRQVTRFKVSPSFKKMIKHLS